MRPGEPGPLNNLFIKHFPELFLFKIFSRKNWRGGDGLLFKVGIIDDFCCNHVIALNLYKG